MTETLTPPSFSPLRDAERATLDQLWQSGRLQRHVECLERFYREKRHQFRQRLQSQVDSGELTKVAKSLVIENGTVDPHSETLDQIKAIESEIWIQGEQGNHDRNRIATEWTERYAQAWRDWRLKEYLYTIERTEARHLADCL